MADDPMETTTTDDTSYEWLHPREGVIRRSDIYVGSGQPRSIARRVLGIDGTVHDLSVSLAPAIEKLFDEIVVNGIDHKIRDPKMNKLNISVDGTGAIFVSNDGSQTIPTGLWPGSTVPTPQVLFHELHSGSNLDDTKRKAVGGRNGVGATVTNFLSLWFVVEISSVADGVTYVQRFERNGATVHPPKYEKYKGKTCKTSISFLPDYARFGCSLPLEQDVLSLLVGRAIDAAACTSAQVYVNGTKLAIRTLKQYALAFGGAVMGQDGSADEMHSNSVGVQICVTDQCSPATQVCFVNGVRCTGTLMDACIKQLSSGIIAKYSTIAPKHLTSIVCDNVSVFISARITNPSFTSQSKDVLDTPLSKLGFEIPQCSTLIKKIDKIPAVQASISQRLGKNDGTTVTKALKSHGKMGANVTKHEKATKLHSSKGPMKTLYIAEGDSAKAMIVTGFGVIGREYNGVYPLRGKLLNVHDLSGALAVKNTEILELISILNLDMHKTYDAASMKRLPYGRLMVVTDQDHDGSHILGLVLTIFKRFFPSLLSLGFVWRMVTPVVRVRLQGKGNSLDFFSMSAFHQWEDDRKAATTSPSKVSSVDYYKGLGTSTNAEAKAYFTDLAKHTVKFASSPEGMDAISVFFAKDRSADRKVLLKNVDRYSCVDYATDVVSIEDFCHKELVHFSLADLERSVPNLVDGFKPSQRKIMHVVLKHPSKHKVEHIAGQIAKDTSYHHGAKNLEQAIICMAQNFTGTNNLNLLEPLGQYGNRHGERAGSPRYIFTKVSDNARAIFRAEDDGILDYNVEEGKTVEPCFFCPVLPLVLVNGADGIGTGWSTFVPTYHVGDVIDACRHVAENGLDSPLSSMQPYSNGFSGKIVMDADHRGVTYYGTYSLETVDVGTSSKPDVRNAVRVTELPPQKKTNDVRQHYLGLNGVLDVSNATTDTVDLLVIFEEEVPKDIVKTLHLSHHVSLTNMNLFDHEGVLQHYDTVDGIVKTFAQVRLDLYVRRIAAQINAIDDKLRVCYQKIELITKVIDGTIVLQNRRRKELKDALGDDVADMLSKMKLDDMTVDAVEERQKEAEALEARKRELQSTTNVKEWLKDLDALEASLGIDRNAKRERDS